MGEYVRRKNSNNLTQTGIRIDSNVWRKIKEMAHEEGVSTAILAQVIFEQYLEASESEA